MPWHQVHPEKLRIRLQRQAHGPKILPFMYLFERFDVLFLVRNLKFADPTFPRMDYIQFASSSTRSSNSLKSVPVHSKSF